MAMNKFRQFSTRDRDNDGHSFTNCAAVLGGGGWWYWNCSNAKLNGVYHHSPNTTDWTGIYWAHWHGWDYARYSLKATTMMVRKT